MEALGRVAALLAVLVVLVHGESAPTTPLLKLSGNLRKPAATVQKVVIGRSASSSLQAKGEAIEKLSKDMVQGAPSPLARAVSTTMNGLGNVLHKMYDQVRIDEKVFQDFQEKMLQKELASADVDISWPAIKNLIKSEVGRGRRKLQDKVAEFKVDLLEMVQKGLDALRQDVRATVTGAALRKKRKELLKKAARAGLKVNNTRVLPRNVTKHLDEFLKRLPASLGAKKDIRKYVTKKLKLGKNAKRAGMIDVRGENAAGALASMKRALSGSLSNKDLQSELFARLQDLTQSYLRDPTPAARTALMALRKKVLSGMKKLRMNATKAERMKLLNQTNTKRALKQKLFLQRAQIKALRNQLHILRSRKPVVVALPVEGAVSSTGGTEHLKRLLRAGLGKAKPVRRGRSSHEPALDALEAQAEAAVRAAEHAAEGQTDVNRIAAHIHKANQHITQLTREVTQRVRRDMRSTLAQQASAPFSALSR